MKKFIIIMISITMMILLTGCENYPTVEVCQSSWLEDQVDIRVGDKYEFKDFQKKEDGDNLTVIINFVKSKNGN